MSRLLIVCVTLLVLNGCNESKTTSQSNGSTANVPGLTASELESLKCPGELPDNASLIDNYHVLSVCQWPVRMSADLYNSDKAQWVFDALRIDLGVVQSRLPAQIANDLRSVTIWLELNVPTTLGGVYHPSVQWLEQNGYPTKWAKGVQIGNADNYLNWRQHQPAMVLHELAHAYDDQYFNSANPDVLAAYEAAKQAGIYEAVAHVQPEQGLVEAYALVNSAEYFAELTEAYFWTNDFFPFNRAQLQSHDAGGFNAVKTMWRQ